MDTRVKPAYDGVRVVQLRISHRSFLGPSVIAARKFLHVSGGFRGPRSRSEEREAERRKAHLGSRDRSLFPGSPGNRGHGNASRRSTGGDFFDPGTVASERRRELEARHPGRFPHPSPVSSSPLKGSPRSRADGYPRPPECAGHDPHARRRRSHPAPRSVLGNAPQWDEMARNIHRKVNMSRT
jgi:hypothetical protein